MKKAVSDHHHLQVYKNKPMWKSVSSASESGSGTDNKMEIRKIQNIKLSMHTETVNVYTKFTI